MRRALAHLALAPLVLELSLAPLLATCGGGGGGGMGGVNPGGAPEAEVYRVPWKVLSAGAPAEPSASGLALYWFPVTRDEARESQLLDSRYLTLAFAPCGGTFLVPSDGATLRARYGAVDGKAIALLATADGTEIGRVEADKGQLKLSPVEKLVRTEIDRRRKSVESKLDEAEARQKAGENDAAKTLYREIYADRCLLPGSGRKASKALKRLGIDVEIEEANERLGALRGEFDLDRRPDLSEAKGVEMAALLAAGLEAEFALRLDDARRAYERAHEADPVDPVALRFLAEYHRHHSGDWKLARQLFAELLARPADDVSRAVALHGLGKMTIHAGDFAGGVAMIERSVATFPLPLAYRNLAVYWNSEGRFDRAFEYVGKALELAPDDLYNRIFAATYLVGQGKPEEAERAALEHASVLEASYNLAAIWAQLGRKEKALEYLARHFYEYERFDPVRAREMREARDDIAFASLHKDADFIELTKLADVDFDSYHLNGAR
jgi:tetratricopeptide (TPR) repeat protein